MIIKKQIGIVKPHKILKKTREILVSLSELLFNEF
jgi:hypothetical protein